MSDGDLRQVRLRWTGSGLAFEGGPPGGARIGIDSDGVAGPSPMEALLLSVAGCMAIDVLMILEKSRVPVDSLEVDAVGERAPSVPKRYGSVRLVFELEGPAPDDRSKVDRAIDLSRDKYCSVLHTLDPELDVDILVHTA